MGLFKLAAAGAVSYALYRMINRPEAAEPAAFAPGEATGTAATFGETRNAGPHAMRSDVLDWDGVDQTSDESFPASDPPGNY